MSESEGASLAASHGIGFCEVSVADNTPNLYKAFERLLNDSKGRPVKQRKFSVSKMIGKYKYILNYYEITSSTSSSKFIQFDIDWRLKGFFVII